MNLSSITDNISIKFWFTVFIHNILPLLPTTFLKNVEDLVGMKEGDYTHKGHCWNDD